MGLFFKRSMSNPSINLAKELGVTPEVGYVDECHMCYLIRRAMIETFPEHLAPGQVYGYDDSAC